MKKNLNHQQRLLKLYRATRASDLQSKDRRPRVALDFMSRYFTFKLAQKQNSLTGALINAGTYIQLVRIQKAAMFALTCSVAVVSTIVAMKSLVSGALMFTALLIAICVVRHHVQSDISETLHVSYLETFIDSVEQAEAVLNPPHADQLQWLRSTVEDLSATAYRHVSECIESTRLDEAKKLFDLFGSLGLVTGENQKKLRKILFP